MSSDANLAQALSSQCQELVELALACPRGGGPKWDATLQSLGAPRLDDATRERHLCEGAPLQRGPLPLELRGALDCVAAPYLARFDDTGRGPAIVQEALRGYLSQAKPRPTTSSIFANAMATTQRYDGTSAGTNTLACKTCGAPRMHEREALHCEYCASTEFV